MDVVLAGAIVQPLVFAVAACIVLMGAAGVILSKNPVHSALSLVSTLFGVAVLFIVQDAQFLAAVQVIVYAGAIVVLFLFVIMLLGVDRVDDLETEPLVGQRPLAIVAGALMAGALGFIVVKARITGVHHSTAAVDAHSPNVNQLGRVIFTSYLFPFEVTSALLVIAVVGAVVLARSAGAAQVDDDEPVTEFGHRHGHRHDGQPVDANSEAGS